MEIDGHDLAAIDQAYAEAISVADRPTAIIARTKKGRGVAAVENLEGKHGKPVPDEREAVAKRYPGGATVVELPAGDADAVAAAIVAWAVAT